MFREYKYMILDITTGKVVAVTLPENFAVGQMIGKDIKIVGKLIKG